MPARPTVSVVDDDTSVRESLPDLLDALGFDARTFVSGEDFLASGSAEASVCLILDVGLPGMSGPDLQSELASRGSTSRLFSSLQTVMSRFDGGYWNTEPSTARLTYSAAALQHALKKATTSMD